MDNIKDIIQDLVKGINIQKKDGVSFEFILNKILTEKERKHAVMLGINGKTVTIIVDSSLWLYHLNMKKKKMLTIVQQHVPEIDNIKFKIGKV
ncbi:MAG: DUF721 domain-containing protein [Candidatus Omnitrophica bacterium]|nr:DUF721 domain-containing protein [Candidatus Omnitrophota bacterium]